MNKYYFPWIAVKPTDDDSEMQAKLAAAAEKHCSGMEQGDIYPCNMNKYEYELAYIIMTSPLQQRNDLEIDCKLCEAARYKAKLMYETGVYAHVVDGIGPNTMVHGFDFNLANGYNKGVSSKANNVESIHASPATPQAAFDSWLTSEAHRRHILGDHSFYRKQNCIGVGYYCDPGFYFTETRKSRYNPHWCVLIAEKN